MGPYPVAKGHYAGIYKSVTGTRVTHCTHALAHTHHCLITAQEQALDACHAWTGPCLTFTITPTYKRDLLQIGGMTFGFRSPHGPFAFPYNTIGSGRKRPLPAAPANWFLPVLRCTPPPAPTNQDHHLFCSPLPGTTSWRNLPDSATACHHHHALHCLHTNTTPCHLVPLPTRRHIAIVTRPFDIPLSIYAYSPDAVYLLRLVLAGMHRPIQNLPSLPGRSLEPRLPHLV